MSEKIFTQADLDHARYEGQVDEFTAFLMAMSIAVLTADVAQMGIGGFVELIDPYVKKRSQILDAG